jgi:hypothetical protein
MGVFTERAAWEEEIFQLELTSPAMGGPDGPLNAASGQLANRTQFLKLFADEVAEAREGEATLKDRINKRGVEPQDILSRYQYIGNEPVVASTGNVNLVTGGTQTIDGVECAIGNLVFLKDQTNPVENGFWEVQSGAWNRYAGYRPENTDCFTYKFIPINKGTVNAGKIFFLDTDMYAIDEDNLNFKESIFSHARLSGKAVIRDKAGKSGDITTLYKTLTAHGESREGRNLFDVLGVTSIAGVVAALRARCNGTGLPDFTELLLGDYLDLSSLTVDGTAYAWNSNYKNLRLVVSGFNTYKNMGDTENTKNHIVFTFRNCVHARAMSPENNNAGGYPASAMKTYLDGVFATGLRAALGGDYLYPVKRLISNKDVSPYCNWYLGTVWLPTEIEVFGVQSWGDELKTYSTPIQIPIYQDSFEYRVKRLNGSRHWWWLSSPTAALASSFCNCDDGGNTHYTRASSLGGVAPDSVRRTRCRRSAPIRPPQKEKTS